MFRVLQLDDVCCGLHWQHREHDAVHRVHKTFHVLMVDLAWSGLAVHNFLVRVPQPFLPTASQQSQ